MTLTYILKGLLIWHFCCRSSCQHLDESLVKIVRCSDFLKTVTLTYIFEVGWSGPFCCWPRCYHCDRNLVKIGWRIAEILAKLCNDNLCMTLIYDGKVILVFFLIAHYFLKHTVKNDENRLHSARDDNRRNILGKS